MSVEKANIGTDVIEVNRFRKMPIMSHHSFYESIFTNSEMKYCLKYTDPYPHLAGIFAAKEAIIKCLNRPLQMSHIEIGREKEGRPIVVIDNDNSYNIKISISHTRSLAIAVALVTDLLG